MNDKMTILFIVFILIFSLISGLVLRQLYSINCTLSYIVQQDNKYSDLDRGIIIDYNGQRNIR